MLASQILIVLLVAVTNLAAPPAIARVLRQRHLLESCPNCKSDAASPPSAARGPERPVTCMDKILTQLGAHQTGATSSVKAIKMSAKLAVGNKPEDVSRS